MLLAFVLVAAGLLFKQLADLLLLLAITIIVALPIAAGATRLERLGVPRVLGAVVSMVFGLGIVALLLWLLVPVFVHQVNDFANHLPTSLARIERKVNHTFGLKPATVTGAVQRFVQGYTHHPDKLLGPLVSLGVTVVSAVAALAVMLITALYMAIAPAALVRGLVRLVPPPHRSDAARILELIRIAWLGWLRGIALDMLVLGGLLYLGLSIVGLPFAVGFALFSALLTVIPNYGSVISAIPPILFGLAHSFNQGVLVAVVYVVVNQIEGNLVLPLIMGRVVSMHPAVIAIGVLLAGAVFGVLGLVISVPLMSLTQILIEHLWIRPLEERDRVRPVASRSPPANSAHRAVLGAILLGAVLVVVGLLVQQLVTLLLAVLVTIILSLPLAWCATVLERRGIPRALGALLGLAVGLGVLGGLLALLVPTLIDQVKVLINSAPSLVHGIEVKVSHLTGERPGHLAARLQGYAATYARDPQRLFGPIASIGLSAATVVGGLVIAIITSYYIAVRPDPLIAGVVRLVRPRRRGDATRVLGRLRTAWIGWLRGVLVAMVIIGALLYVCLHFIVGLHFALFFAIFSAIAEVVPYFGALVSGVPPVAFALTVSPGTALVVLAIYVAVHQLEANVIGPVVMSRAVRLHPAVIAFGVVAVGQLFGFLGLLIAVPLIAAVIILGEEIWVRPHELGSTREDGSATPAR